MTKQELATKIWETSNVLRKKIKAQEFKDYILGFMFYKYLSDKEEQQLKEYGATKEDLKEVDEETINMIKTDIGYFIPYENLYSTWKTMKSNLGAATVTEALQDFNRNYNAAYKNVFENIFATLENGLTKLSDLSGSRDEAVRSIIDLIDEIPTTHDTYDVLGYVYEFLMYKFASNAKEDGAYYTPNEVSILMSQIIAEAMKDKDELAIYDPTCGSGSLLLNIGKEASKYIDKDKIKYYGQELITETYNLTRMNLVMKGINTNSIFVRNGDTLEDDWPYFDEETSYDFLPVDAVASNPPYSNRWNPDKHEGDPRFSNFGLAPSSKADYAFLLHCLYHLKSDGIMTIVLPHGILFRGGSEGQIRKKLIEENHIETIIGLPSNLFFATGIPTIIVVLRKNRKDDDILFIDASQCYSKVSKQNVLRKRDIKSILDTIKERKNIDNFSKLVSKKEIIANDYNLNIPRYVSSSNKTEQNDLYSVMTGQVSNLELSPFEILWNTFPLLREKLLTQTDGGYNYFNDVDIKEIIHNDTDINNFKNNFNTLSEQYQDYLIDVLISNILSTDTSTQDKLTDKLFDIFSSEKLVDKYAIYQAFAEKWPDIETDLEIIRENGLEVCTQVEPNMVTKKNKQKETYEEQNGWKGTIIPFELIKKMYFQKDFKIIEELENSAANSHSTYSEIFENLDEDIKSEVQKKDEEKDEIKDEFDEKKLFNYVNYLVSQNNENTELIENLKTAKKMISKEKDYQKQIKSIISTLDDKAKEKLESLTKDEVEKVLIEKWIIPVLTEIKNVVNNTIDEFCKQLKAIKEKYSNPLEEIEKEINEKNDEIISLMSELVGSEKDIEALSLFMKLL